MIQPNPLPTIDQRQLGDIYTSSELIRTVHRSEKYHRSILGGAAAFLYVSQYEAYGPETGSIANDREALIPGISISKESGAYLQRLAERHGTLRLRLKSTDRSAP